MSKILGIDTSNYTTSVAVIEEGTLIYDNRKILDVDLGKKGLRQSEALFQHIKNLPILLESHKVQNINAVAVSTKPRPCEGSYMPVFKAGETVAKSIASVLGIPLIETTHQEGHIEAGCYSIGFNEDEFIVFHMSGGTSEILMYNKNKENTVELIGGTKDISFGQFLDRVGVALGFDFPAGKYVDELALSIKETELIIPSRVEGLYFNLSGQETQAQKYIEKGFKKEEIALATMKCVAKTLDKLIATLLKTYNKKILLIGGVASSKYIAKFINKKYNGSVFISKPEFAQDNAIGVALIGLKKLYNCNNRRD